MNPLSVTKVFIETSLVLPERQRPKFIRQAIKLAEYHQWPAIIPEVLLEHHQKTFGTPPKNWRK